MAFYDKVWKWKIPQILFYIGLTIELGIVIVDKSRYINPIEGQLFRVTFVLFALKLLLTEYNRKEWLLIFLMEAVGLISYRVTGKNDIIRIVTFMAACKDIPMKQILRYFFYVTLIGCIGIIFLAVTGIYGDISLATDYGRGFDSMQRVGVREVRYTLGMGHPNALACMFLMLLALGIYIYSERLKWYVYLFLALLSVGVYKLTDSSTGLIVAALLLTASFLMTYSSFLREKKVAYICGFLVFLLCLGFSVDAAARAPKVRQAWWEETYWSYSVQDPHTLLLLKIDRHLTGRIVSLTDSDNNDGAIESWKLFSAPGNMDYYFDMGWVKLFYRYGIVPGLLFCLACLALLWQFFRKKDAFGLVVFSALGVYTVIEAHLVSVYIGRNFLLAMIGCCLFGASLREKEGLAPLVGKR